MPPKQIETVELQYSLEHYPGFINNCCLLQETSFANYQPVTRSLSSVGKKSLSGSRLPTLGEQKAM